MKALIITSTFPPFAGSHVQRMLKMTNALCDKGIDVSVLTYEINENHPQYDESFVQLVNPDINIIRAPLGYFHKKAYSTFKNEVKGKTSEIKGIKQAIYNTVNKVKKDIFFPDTLVDWYYSVIHFEKKQRIVQKLMPDVIISCSMPNSVHLIGFKLSKMYGIPLYMDYADPWTYIDDQHISPKSVRFKRSRRIESRILRHSIGVSFSAPGCQNLYIQKFGLPIEKTTVAMSGFEERLLLKANAYNGEKKSRNKMMLTYGGALHDYVRNPKPFFEASQGFENEIDVVIRTDNIVQAKQWLKEAGGASCIKIDGYINFDDYFVEMLSSDVILFFGNMNDIQVPGKIFNCIATGRYILYIKSNDAKIDTVEQILNAYGRSIVTNNNIRDITNALNRMITIKDRIQECDDLTEGNLMQFSDVNQYENIVTHLRSLLSK